MSEQKNALSVKVEVDTKEAKENVKELTAAVNECVEAFEKLENVMDRFTNKGELKDIQIGIVLDGRVTAESIIRKVNEIDEIKRKF
ncbi:hypothetical protein OWO94_13090 [Bacillus paranthracis]|uniref:hypothetical protein n=1 Tax=Bacillus TaxID=1386 RepID=UPI001CC99245|nr:MULTISPECIES: hypothetical protein [Bacillus]MCU4999526.1 hypothetical protein [Bacillus tropicus]MDK7537855.1 hypothetical protein [Bacillus paranthracis]MDK7560939.1 hypothetical protein [Bacillus paranthracis]UBM49753.1 hypothetical protein K8M08_22680 [Bacillus sp. CRB-7]